MAAARSPGPMPGAIFWRPLNAGSLSATVCGCLSNASVITAGHLLPLFNSVCAVPFVLHYCAAAS